MKTLAGLCAVLSVAQIGIVIYAAERYQAGGSVGDVIVAGTAAFACVFGLVTLLLPMWEE